MYLLLVHGFFLGIKMNFAKKYLSKQNTDYLFYPKQLASNYALIVVIPCCNEPQLDQTLHSLFNCNTPQKPVLVIVVVNHSTNASAAIVEQNQLTLSNTKQIRDKAPNWIDIETIDATNMPIKHAGVGFARKIGMDSAVSIFNLTNNKNGIIASLDADTTVSVNYFEALIAHFIEHPKNIGATLCFEHPLSDKITGTAITQYELYMRYYKNAVQHAHFPHSIYTIGSAFCVLAGAYVAQGGMNRRQAGEDFYFLHKLSQFGEIGLINETVVIPSARLSDRVPFGTGPAINKLINQANDTFLTYALKSILVLKDIFDKTEMIYSKNMEVDQLTKNNVLQDFLTITSFTKSIDELKSNCSNLQIFTKRFFHYFNAFMVLKWLNYAVEHGFEKKPLSLEALKLLKKMNPEKDYNTLNVQKMLKHYREFDKIRSK